MSTGYTCNASKPGSLMVLLHDFSELWYAWRHQIQALPDAVIGWMHPTYAGDNTFGTPPGCAITSGGYRQAPHPLNDSPPSTRMV
jgi:hypothetical protein